MQYARIAILTGAGISAESGIPVFRSETGLWEQHRVEDVATYEGYLRDKVLVHNFYNGLRQNLKTKEPNAGHRALTHLQEELEKKGGRVDIITQNIDNLHEKAFSKHILHIHGQLNTLICEHCQHRIPFFDNSSPSTECPHCHQLKMRPDIVWFGEVPYQLDEVEQILNDCDLFISIGTSGEVYPAAGFAAMVRYNGKPCIEFNLAPSANKVQFKKGYYGKSSETLPRFVEYLLAHDELPESL